MPRRASISQNRSEDGVFTWGTEKKSFYKPGVRKKKK